ncbi:MAG: phasin family protein [Candidatus Competibacteraceae bacterium]
MTAALPHWFTDNLLTRSAINSTRQIWLAGLGAYVIAEREGGELFSALVRRGKELEAQAIQQAEDTIGGLQGYFGEAHENAFKSLNKLEKVFQKRVMRALRRLGIPNREDIRYLARQVEALQQCVDEIIRLDQAQQTLAAKEPSGKVETA